MIGLQSLYGAGALPRLFETGHVVHHKLYGYRGVIVAADPVCRAGDSWSYANKTQPERNQPWYHVLVHESGGISTYVAQSNLEPDESMEPIDHPRISCYFECFENGAYVSRSKHPGCCSS